MKKIIFILIGTFSLIGSVRSESTLFDAPISVFAGGKEGDAQRPTISFGDAFFQIDSTGINYSVWVAASESFATTGAFISDGSTTEIMFKMPVSMTVSGCAIMPINPYIPSQSKFLVTDLPIITCPALIVYQVFSGRLENRTLAGTVLDAAQTSFQIDVPNFGVSNHALQTIPEPSILKLLIPAGGIVIFQFVREILAFWVKR